MERIQGLDESLDTISVRVPRWAKDVYIKVGSDADLKPGEAIRVVLTAVAEILIRNWERGPALGAYLETLHIAPHSKDRKTA